MRCEVCGRRIYGKPNKTVIEGARLVVCSECTKLGTQTHTHTLPEQVRRTSKTRTKQKRLVRKANQKPSLKPTMELVTNYGVRIREARNKQGFSHENLGRKISEKVSILKKLESQKMRPDNKLARKLEHTLKITLLVPANEEKFPKGLFLNITQKKSVTLGDLIKSKPKFSEEKK